MSAAYEIAQRTSPPEGDAARVTAVTRPQQEAEGLAIIHTVAAPGARPGAPASGPHPMRRATDVPLSPSERRLAAAAADAAAWDIDLATGALAANGAFFRLIGVALNEKPFSLPDWMSRLHPDDRDRVLAGLRAAGDTYEDEFRIRRADTGEERWIAVHGRPMGARTGQIAGTAHDITAQHVQHERQILMAREAEHRARNLLAVVRSIVRRTCSEDPQDFAAAIDGRIAALARSLPLLSRDCRGSMTLDGVLREELEAHGGAGRVTLDGPPLSLSQTGVQALSMALHELATNASKYGALSRPTGQVAVTWRTEPGAEAGQTRLVVTWVERGGPAVTAPPAHKGFGSHIMDAMICRQLGGALAFAWLPEGLRCEIAIAAEAALATEGFAP
jgi:two-component sensor histidine kinase